MSEHIILSDSFDNNNNSNSRLTTDDGGCSDDSCDERKSTNSSLESKVNEDKTSNTDKSQHSDDESPVARKRKASSFKRRSTRRRSTSAYSDSSRSSSRSGALPNKRKRDRRSTSGSSRGTYDGFDFELEEHAAPFSCKQCHRGYYTVRELAEHDIRQHGIRVFCATCPKVTDSVTKLSSHMVFRHAEKPAVCHYCGKIYGDKCDDLNKTEWHDFRTHIHKEILKRKTNELCTRLSSRREDSTALRGVGRCPHGAPVKCKNFPQCPGARCIYSHGLCRYDITCNKLSCPFDHTSRPRTCMSCINDIKSRRR